MFNAGEIFEVKRSYNYQFLNVFASKMSLLGNQTLQLSEQERQKVVMNCHAKCFRSQLSLLNQKVHLLII